MSTNQKEVDRSTKVTEGEQTGISKSEPTSRNTNGMNSTKNEDQPMNKGIKKDNVQQEKKENINKEIGQTEIYEKNENHTKDEDQKQISKQEIIPTKNSEKIEGKLDDKKESKEDEKVTKKEIKSKEKEQQNGMKEANQKENNEKKRKHSKDEDQKQISKQEIKTETKNNEGDIENNDIETIKKFENEGEKALDIDQVRKNVDNTEKAIKLRDSKDIETPESEVGKSTKKVVIENDEESGCNFSANKLKDTDILTPKSVHVNRNRLIIAKDEIKSKLSTSAGTFYVKKPEKQKQRMHVTFRNISELKKSSKLKDFTFKSQYGDPKIIISKPLAVNFKPSKNPQKKMSISDESFLRDQIYKEQLKEVKKKELKDRLDDQRLFVLDKKRQETERLKADKFEVKLNHMIQMTQRNKELEETRAFQMKETKKREEKYREYLKKMREEKLIENQKREDEAKVKKQLALLKAQKIQEEKENRVLEIREMSKKMREKNRLKYEQAKKLMTINKSDRKSLFLKLEESKKRRQRKLEQQEQASKMVKVSYKQSNVRKLPPKKANPTRKQVKLAKEIKMALQNISPIDLSNVINNISKGNKNSKEEKELIDNLLKCVCILFKTKVDVDHGKKIFKNSKILQRFEHFDYVNCPKAIRKKLKKFIEIPTFIQKEYENLSPCLAKVVGWIRLVYQYISCDTDSKNSVEDNSAKEEIINSDEKIQASRPSTSQIAKNNSPNVSQRTLIEA